MRCQIQFLRVMYFKLKPERTFISSIIMEFIIIMLI